MDDEAEIVVFGVRGVLQSRVGKRLETHGYSRAPDAGVAVDEARVYALLGRRLRVLRGL